MNIKPLPTNQEIFDRVASHLLAQGRRSEREVWGTDMRPAYRGDGGLKCAIGCLIDDAVYDREVEGLRVTTDHVLALLRQSHILPDWRPDGDLPETTATIGMLAALQHVHDREPPEHWHYILGLLADECGLSHDVLDDYAMQERREHRDAIRLPKRQRENT